jgi:hypothetical protein
MARRRMSKKSIQKRITKRNNKKTGGKSRKYKKVIKGGGCSLDDYLREIKGWTQDDLKDLHNDKTGIMLKEYNNDKGFLKFQKEAGCSSASNVSAFRGY